jgi:hypothetical protein
MNDGEPEVSLSSSVTATLVSECRPQTIEHEKIKNLRGEQESTLEEIAPKWNERVRII